MGGVSFGKLPMTLGLGSISGDIHPPLKVGLDFMSDYRQKKRAVKAALLKNKTIGLDRPYPSVVPRI